MIHPPKDKAERDERLDLVLRTIEENPQHWDQDLWHCGSSHCFAGFAQCFARGVSWSRVVAPLLGSASIVVGDEKYYAPSDARVWLGLASVPLTADLHDRLNEIVDCDIEDLEPEDVCDFLFYGSNTLEDLRRIVSEIKATPYEPAAPAA